ncbi:MAG: OmpA family protein [Thiomargarita sp.]|nr:OmpA family protein [Thiomargarita sp.]
MKPIITCFVAAFFVSGCNTSVKPSGSTMTTQSTASFSMACNNYATQVNRAKQSKNLDKLSQLLKTLKSQSDCSQAYLKTLERELSEIATQKASVLVKRGEVKQAEKWLEYQYTPVNLWSTQALRGDIAAKGKQWKTAAEFYNHALDLMDNPTATPTKPSPAEIKMVHSLATETQLLAGELIAINGRSGESSGAMRDNIRGVEIRERPIPVQFVFGKTALTEAGKDSANKLLAFFQNQNSTRITLIGYTDRIGSDATNCILSRGRALALKDYLIEQGCIETDIITMGKGKRQPLEPYDPSRYTQDMIDQMNRRVEFAIDREVSHTNQCL